MAMRLDLTFARPLGRPEKLAIAAAVAALVKARAVRFQRGDRAAWVIAEDLGRERLRQALADVGIEAESITSSLSDDSRCEEAEVTERVKAPGR